jgi:glutathione S-transferase
VELTLYGHRESGHTYKIRLMLAVAGLPYHYEDVDLWLPHEERPEPFRSLSQFGEAPLLVHDGRPYVQSNAILLHLADVTGAFGADSPERMAQSREWLFWEANRIGLSLPNLRFGLKFTPGGLPAAVEALWRSRLAADLARMDAVFGDGRDFILGDSPSVGDFALCGYLFWPEQAGIEVPAHVQGWLGRIAALPGWRHPYDLPGHRYFVGAA